MDYRKYYQELTNKKIPKGYEIHHIDLNRDNNNINNLVMLPKKLHQEYHRTLSNLNYVGEVNTEITTIIQNGNANNYLIAKRISEFVDVWEECNKWNDYKYYLLGIIPNIHNIEVNYNGTKKNV